MSDAAEERLGPDGREATASGSAPEATASGGTVPGGMAGAGATASGVIRVRVRLFARLRELAGAREVAVELSTGATVDAAWRALESAHPAVAPMRPHVRFAVDGRYADAGTVLRDGAEVACIPPVSGGSGDPADEAPPDSTGAHQADVAALGPDAAAGDARRSRVLAVRSEPFDASILADLTAELATEADGAVVGFIGRTRITPGEPAPGEEAEAARYAGIPVEALEYEAHEPLTLRTLGEIADEVEARFGVSRLAIVHRTGIVPLGEAAVAIVAVSPHRAEAFAAAEYAMDETKARAPIWKAEVHAGGHVWIGAPARSGPGEAAEARPATEERRP